MTNVGVLDIQGSVSEHFNILKGIENVNPIRVKYKEDINHIDGLILPGGESTTIGKLLKKFDIMDTLKKQISNGLPVWGTCAGMILLAKKIVESENVHIGTMDIEVKRNAYGSQLESFIIKKKIKEVSSKEIPMVFIRAPYINKVGNQVKILKKYNDKIIAAREKNMVVTSFHPELTNDDSFHRYFIKVIKNKI
ncbi:MAG: pyridoxal 5'-phosphate synthase glutaminase subunit PdxT [Firmicutes bacterium]|nr:pyridoxal 5'-phosphate synthase glutaminase subunit PdxT [Bacillota bacterium]